MLFYKWMLSIAPLALIGCGPNDHWQDDEEPEVSPAAEIIQRRLEDSSALDSTLTNLPQILSTLNLHRAHASGGHGQGLTIAVLDNGFAGLAPALGKRLPPDLRVEHAPKNKPAKEPHGTKMAELIYAVATGSVNYSPERPGPELLLYNTNGYTNLVHAIDEVIRRNVDIVLYAQIWEYGGNGDGSGFINAQVNRATAAGILWINAAGNYGKSTYSGHVETGPDGFVTLPYQNKYVRLRVEQNTPAKISLGWNDFRDTIAYRTEQDLDLEIYSADGRKLNESSDVQNGDAEAGRPGKKSAHAREVILTDLAQGEYLLAVKAKSNNFSADSRLWLAVNGPDLFLLDKGQNNSIFIPADNPTVLSVGASDVDFSSSRDLDMGPAKPELVSFSHVYFDDGQSFAGTSAASAIATGALAAMASAGYTDLSRQGILDALGRGDISSSKISLGLNRPKAPFLRLP